MMVLVWLFYILTWPSYKIKKLFKRKGREDG